MISLYDPRPAGATLAQPSSPRVDRTSMRPGFWDELEAKRYDFLAAKFRDLGSPVYAEMCDGFASEHRAIAERLNDTKRQEARMAMYYAGVAPPLESDADFPEQGRAAE